MRSVGSCLGIRRPSCITIYLCACCIDFDHSKSKVLQLDAAINHQSVPLKCNQRRFWRRSRRLKIHIDSFLTFNFNGRADEQRTRRHKQTEATSLPTSCVSFSTGFTASAKRNEPPSRDIVSQSASSSHLVHGRALQ